MSLLPFVAPLATVAVTAARLRRVPWIGMLAAFATAGIAIGDLDRVRDYAYVELLLAAGGLALSIASFAGVHRRSRAATAPFVPTPVDPGGVTPAAHDPQ